MMNRKRQEIAAMRQCSKEKGDYAQPYSSCVRQIGMKLFTSIAAWMNYIIIGGNATNVFPQSLPPSDPTFMRIDDQFAEWYDNKYGKQLDRAKVLPVLHALQGYPESGTLWGKHAFAVLQEFGFQTTTYK
eukprot:10861039-Ditylum_brightwellii.AAC.1